MQLILHKHGQELKAEALGNFRWSICLFPAAAAPVHSRQEAGNCSHPTAAGISPGCSRGSAALERIHLEAGRVGLGRQQEMEQFWALGRRKQQGWWSVLQGLMVSPAGFGGQSCRSWWSVLQWGLQVISGSSQWVLSSLRAPAEVQLPAELQGWICTARGAASHQGTAKAALAEGPSSEHTKESCAGQLMGSGQLLPASLSGLNTRHGWSWAQGSGSTGQG